MKNNLIFSTNFLWPHHFSELIDFGVKKSKNGEKVFIAKCDGSISYCATNPLNVASVCRSCIRMQQIFQNEFSEFTWLSFSHYNSDELECSEEQLKNTVASIYNTAPFRCSSTNGSLKSDYMLINSFIKRKINEHKINRLVLWNGRRISEGDGAVHNIDRRVEIISIISASGSLHGYDTYLAFQGPKIHNMAVRKKHILEFKKSVSKSEIENMAAPYFNFAAGKTSYNTLGLSNFQKNFRAIPNNELIDYDYMIANGTYVEFYGHDGWELDFGEDFNDIVEIIIREILAVKSYAKIVVRWHPNLRRVSRIEHKKITSMQQKFPTVNFISPESNISTHDLLMQSKVVFSVGSSIGIEASKMGIEEVYFLGRNYFEDLRAFKHLRSIDELRNSIKAGKKTYKVDADLFGAYIGCRSVEKITAVNVLPKQVIKTLSGTTLKPPFLMKVYLRFWIYALRYIGPNLVRWLR